MKAKTTALLLMLLGVMFFGVFLYWGYNDLDRSYGAGIFVVAIGTFMSGIIPYFND